MPHPSSSLATLRPDIASAFEEFDLEMQRRGYIASQVLPVFETAEQSGKFGRIPIEQLLDNRDTRRAPGSGYNRGTFTFTAESYATEEHGVEEPIDDREAKMYRHYFDAELIAGQRAFESVLSSAEQRVADMVFNTSTWTGASLTTAVSVPWSTYATATPVADVEAAILKVWANSGLWPNALIMERHVFRHLRQCAEIIERIESNGAGGSTLAGNITTQQLATAFDLDKIIIAGSAKNSANEGQAVSIGSIWPQDKVMVARVAIGNDFREPCLGRTFHWAGDGSDYDGRFESYRDETVRSDIIRVRHDVDEKILYPQAGHLLTAVTS